MKEIPNVIIIIVDSLREDYSEGLDALRSYGFTKYENCITCSPWTLPSHVSMYTGLMPFEHGVHERNAKNYSALHTISSKVLTSRDHLLKIAKRAGLITHCYTSNPMISPFYGFDFDHFNLFGSKVNFEEFSQNILTSDETQDRTIAMIRKKKLWLLWRLFYEYRLKAIMKHVLGQFPMEKGSKACISEIRKTKFQTPFFLYLNVMEAHEPYYWKGHNLTKGKVLSMISGQKIGELNWKQRYPKHAALAESRAAEAIECLHPYLDQSLVILTADHGQMLGERGRYGHGLFLDDELLRVPFYVKYPSGMEPIVQSKDFMNLSSLFAIVKYVLENKLQDGIFSDFALSESYGFFSNPDPALKKDEQAELFLRSKTHRMKILLKEGKGILNLDTNETEELIGKISAEQIMKILNEIDYAGKSKNNWEFSSEEEELVTTQLKYLGYD